MRCAAVTFVLLALVSAAGAADPAKPGRLKIGVTTVDAVDTARENRTLPTEIWYPASEAGRDTEPLPRAFPLILMAHGFCGSRTNYEFLTVHLASHGFVVAAPDFTGVTSAACAAGQVTADIDDLPLDLDFVCRDLHDVTGPLAKFAQRVRGIPTGLVGHSLGGRAVVEATRMFTPFTATIGLAPAVAGPDADGLDELKPRRAWMVMGGTADTLVSFTDWTQPFFDGLPTPSFLVRVTGGTHSGFSDADSRLTPDELTRQQDVTKRYATAFFVKYLARKNQYARRLRTSDDGTIAVTARAKK
jgi:predicted dienelactone hydrolase